ncbi:hypothetical protein PoB_005144800 [Plakobranchus ocellatus]|uniref:Uncharacterized protein n=1 Tax=Plakobranchus ocellatus TaxID=259542 RepID=A0AAV4C1T7_9GAST|nr:hypothetical protein PoB_005144800 [Plakobranchus ocellatus]
MNNDRGVDNEDWNNDTLDLELGSDPNSEAQSDMGGHSIVFYSENVKINIRNSPGIYRLNDYKIGMPQDLP